MRRNFRVFLMAIMMGLLITYTIMKSHKGWYLYWTTPAQCLFDDLAGNTSTRFISMYIFVTLFAYVPMSIVLYEPGYEACHKWFLIMPTTTLDKSIDIMRRRADFRPKSSCLLNALLLVRALSLGTLAILTSWSFKYLLICTWFAFAIYAIMMDRSLALSRGIGDENKLTFGQFVSIFLLASTMMVFRERYCGKIVK